MASSLRFRLFPPTSDHLVTVRSNDQPGWTPGAVDCQERLVEQCRLVKALNPQTKCFVYRNTELALEWFAAQKAVMDEQHRGWFVNFEDDTVPHNPWLSAEQKCKLAGPCTYSSNGGPPDRPPFNYGSHCCPLANVYCENIGTGGAGPGNNGHATAPPHWQGEQQYFWDFTNASLREWWVENMLVGSLKGNEGIVDGCFSDDVTGIGAEHAGVTDRTGISREKIQALRLATQQVWTRALDKLVEAGGYNWQAFGSTGSFGSGPPNYSPNIAPNTWKRMGICAQSMRTLCGGEYQQRPMLMAAGDGHVSTFNVRSAQN